MLHKPNRIDSPENGATQESDFFQHTTKHITFKDKKGKQQECYAQMGRLLKYKGEVGHWTQEYIKIGYNSVPIITYVINGKVIQPHLQRN